MGNWGISLFVITAFILFIWYRSQTKFRDKMLCFFIRPNKQKIERWVPLYSTHIVFDRGKYGIGQYICDPECITSMWYARGINVFFPTLVPSLEFKWDTPNPINPKTFQSTWHTPEARRAAWEEHQQIAFARAAAAQAGLKRTFIEKFLPLIAIGVALVTLFIVWRGFSGIDMRMFNLEQAIKLLHP